jgi:membrane-associated protease RseP (regulator of RpoE activity)
LYPNFEPHKKFQDRTWRHVVLLIATFVSTTLVGTDHYLSYLADYTRPAATLGWAAQLSGGLWYSGTILLILGAHELGHYLACRYYQVDASLPFFIPMPLLWLTGTLGAFIRIREPIPTKRALFDIGSAGPFAGFVFAVPALFLGVAMSHVAKLPPHFEGINLGEPILFKIASRLIVGPIPDGYSINLHPMAFAAWFGLLATAMNLMPFGQLDGGHITYAVFGRRSATISIATVCAAAALIFVSQFWILWTLLMAVLIMTMGPHHPRTLDEDTPLDRVRLCLALAAVVVFILSFTYAPIESTELLR